MEENNSSVNKKTPENIRSACKKAALSQLKGRWTSAVLATLTFFAVIIITEHPLFRILKKMAQNEMTRSLFFVSYLGIMIFLLFIIAIFGFSLILYNADFAKFSEKITYANFIDKFSYWTTSIKVFFYFILKYLIFYFPIVIVISILFAINAHLNSIILGLLTFAAATAGIIFLIRFLLSITPYYYIMADNPDMKVRDALKLSRKISKGHLGQMFCLMLSFIGWHFLCIPTAGIGMLWLLPYYNLTLYNYVMVLRSNADTTEEENL